MFGIRLISFSASISIDVQGQLDRLRSCRTMCTVWTGGSPRISEGRRRGVQEQQAKKAFVRGGPRRPACPVAPLVDRGEAEAVRADGRVEVVLEQDAPVRSGKAR